MKQSSCSRVIYVFVSRIFSIFDNSICSKTIRFVSPGYDNNILLTLDT